MIHNFILLGYMGVFCVSCNTVYSQSVAPAILVNPNASVRAVIAKTISKALNGKPVALADDVLTTRSSLIIERAQFRTIADHPIDGRRMDRPNHFSLIKKGGACILMHEETGERYVLSGAKCRMAEK